MLHSPQGPTLNNWEGNLVWKAAETSCCIQIFFLVPFYAILLINFCKNIRQNCEHFAKSPTMHGKLVKFTKIQKFFTSSMGELNNEWDITETARSKVAGNRYGNRLSTPHWQSSRVSAGKSSYKVTLPPFSSIPKCQCKSHPKLCDTLSVEGENVRVIFLLN